MRQAQALAVMLAGESVFLTGAPGAGKTYVLNEFVQRARQQGKDVAVTASTGIAATHIGGTTLHSWSGLGIRDRLNDWDRQWLAANARLKKRYNSADILVIDEVSMLHGSRLDMVNEACKILRGNEQPFGGLQVVLVGDLFQLPPVTRGSELFDFAHTSAAWQELNPKVCYLSEQHRQQGDELLNLLEAMRAGALEDVHIEALQTRLGQKPAADQVVTRLYAHNVDVESINQRHLLALSGDTKLYTMQAKGAAAKVEQLAKSILAPENLELKIGAEVMFVANNFAAGFVNGSRGQVIDFQDGWPLVRMLSTQRIIKVELHSWTLVEDERKKAEIAQLPLRLAWAITIHKSQGMSLDAAEIDLSKTFTPGMGYVALSRVRSLTGVYLSGINQMALQLHPAIYDFDRQLRIASRLLAEQTTDAPEEVTPDSTSEESAYDQVLFDKLRAWRLERARTEKVAPFMIAHDSALQELARRKPVTPQKLLATKGFGPQKAETYGPDILKIMHEYTGTESATTSAWTERDNAELLKQFKSGMPLLALTKQFGATPEELWSHLSDLLNQ